MKMTISGIQEAQRGNLQVYNAIQPSGGLGRAVHLAGSAAHRGSVRRTHVITGSLRASERLAFDLSEPSADVYLDPTSVNPQTGQRPSVYGLYEHGRGGSHAYMERTVMEEGSSIARQAIALMMSEMP